MLKVTLSSLALLMFVTASPIVDSSASRVRIRVKPDAHIDLRANHRSTGECHLAINPANSNHMVAAVVSSDPNNETDYSTVSLVSFDGGNTWKNTTMPMKQAADPWVAILPDGTAILGEIALGEVYRQVVYHSRDGGLTWGPPSQSFGNGHDHDMFLYDDSRGGGALYLITTRRVNSRAQQPVDEIFLARFRDGRGFKETSTFSVFPNLHFNAKTPVVFSDGTLAIPVVALGDRVASSTATNRWEPTQSWLITSADRGKTFSKPLFITGAAGRRHNVLAVNKSSKWRDRLYYVFPGPRRNGLYLVMSADRGVGWSVPKRIDKNSASAFTDLGAVAVNSKGEIGILWIDRVDDPERKCQYTYFAASSDGGETFSEPTRVSTAPSCPETKNGWVGKAWPQGGDYCGLVARSDGSFMALWSDARNGTFQLYRAEISLE